MPLAITWSPFLDTELRRMRADGATWDAIGRAFGVSRNAVVDRGRQLGYGRTPLAAKPTAEAEAARADAPGAGAAAGTARPTGRPPLRAGHADTWGAITAGTLLDGAAYPDWTLERLARGEQAGDRIGEAA